MRTECQEAEVALSYLRRLIQGRLDIVHAYLEHHRGPTPRPIWPPWSTTCPASSRRARAARPGRSTCPC